MNENWPEIVETLIPYFETNSVEGDYQREIENCLKFLGWKKTNGTMVSQYTLPIGNSNSIRPDIVLWRKNEHDTQSPVLPIEIKRPSNIQNERQENQLMSYMRQLKLNVGLYIGEKIQLYYDIPNDGENPICVFTAEFKKEDVNGSIICDLLTYDKFNLEKIETFCNEQYKKIQARNNLHRRVSEFLSEGNGVKNMISLLKDKFTAEGFEESAINEEFANLTLTVHYENKSILPSLQLKTRQTSKNSQNDYKESIDRSLSQLHVPFEAMYSTVGRTLARAIEADLVSNWMEDFYIQLLTQIKNGDSRMFNDIYWEPDSWPNKAMGFGLTEAPRGSLAHFVSIENKKVKNYQMVVPTTYMTPRLLSKSLGRYTLSTLVWPARYTSMMNRAIMYTNSIRCKSA